jgi:hypothetical protein
MNYVRIKQVQFWIIMSTCLSKQIRTRIGENINIVLESCTPVLKTNQVKTENTIKETPVYKINTFSPWLYVQYSFCFRCETGNQTMLWLPFLIVIIFWQTIHEIVFKIVALKSSIALNVPFKYWTTWFLDHGVHINSRGGHRVIPVCTMIWSGPNPPAGTTFVLSLQNINRNQAGNYQCTANNDVGSKTAVVVNVDVQCKY